MEKTIGQILIEKLTKEELGRLTDSFEDGSLDKIFYNKLFPADARNYPRKYAKLIFLSGYRP